MSIERVEPQRAGPGLSADELAEIDRHARDANVNLWAASAERKGPARK